MKILNLEILTNDLIETERFYSDVMGFAITAKSPEAISFRAGFSELTFKYVDGVKPIYHVAFNIPCNQLDEALEWVRARVEILDAEPGTKIANFVNWNAKSFYFYDTNSNILEFIVRYNLKDDKDDTFKGSSVNGISEIGLAADDVGAQCDLLIHKHGLPVFSKQPRLANFIAMGDDEGLLILSSVNRLWHLTEHAAQKYHTLLTIQNNGKTQSLRFHQNENGASK